MSLSYIYALIVLGIIGFQIALIFGAPWGRITQGGQVDGALPPVGRGVAAVSVLILIGMGLAFLSAGGHWPNWPRWTVWIALVVNAVSMILNWITPSAPERRLWGPIITVKFAIALAIIWL